jgi:hypothetical protein
MDLRNVDVLRERGLVPRDIRIRPLANLVRSERVGILASPTHSGLSRLYAYTKDVLARRDPGRSAAAGALRPRADSRLRA